MTDSVLIGMTLSIWRSRPSVHAQSSSLQERFRMCDDGSQHRRGRRGEGPAPVFFFCLFSKLGSGASSFRWGAPPRDFHFSPLCLSVSLSPSSPRQTVSVRCELHCRLLPRSSFAPCLDLSSSVSLLSSPPCRPAHVLVIAPRSLSLPHSLPSQPRVSCACHRSPSLPVLRLTTLLSRPHLPICIVAQSIDNLPSASGYLHSSSSDCPLHIRIHSLINTFRR